MNTLFFRIYLKVLALVLVAFFVIFFIANSMFYGDILEEDASQVYATISRALSTKETDQWQNEVAIYNEISSQHNLSLIPQTALTEYEQQQYSANDNSVIIPEKNIKDIHLYVLYPLKNSPWLLKISEGEFDSINDLLDILILFILVFLAFALGLYLLIKAISKPIEHINSYAQKIGQGDLSVRITEAYPAPLDSLANNFNIMTDQLNASLQEQQVLIGAIPHELRTPLSKIRFALDITRNRETMDSLRQDIEKIDTYADQMEEAVDDILELNRLQNQSQATLSSVDLCELLAMIKASYLKDSSSIEININCDVSNASANVPLLKRALQNILNNAQRHAKSVINITALQIKDNTIIRIEDDGEGIDEEKIQDLFIPFSTLDDSRNRNQKGIGLGLAIVKMIMKKHQGDITAKRSSLGGAFFELRW